MGLLNSGKSSFSANDQEEDEIFLNLMPMIDIMTCLLFFLLLSFGAVIIALINASVPVISDGNPDPTVSQLKVTMGLTITDKGMVATASHDKLSEEELAKMKRTFYKKGDKYDIKGLADYLYRIKKKYPKSSSIVITPSRNVEYSVLILAMDASRERPMKLKGRPYNLPLFPEAVVSTLVE